MATCEREARLEELFAAGWTTDRTRVRHGLVCENYVFFDSSEFQRLVGT